MITLHSLNKKNSNTADKAKKKKLEEKNYDDFVAPPSKSRRRKVQKPKKETVNQVTPSISLFNTVSPANDPHLGRLVLIFVKKNDHPALGCDFVSGSYLILGATVKDSEKTLINGDSKVNIHQMIVEKAFTFFDTHTGFQETNTEKSLIILILNPFSHLF